MCTSVHMCVYVCLCVHIKDFYLAEQLGHIKADFILNILLIRVQGN